MKKENIELLISWATITLAFSLVFSDNFLNIFSFLEALPIAAIGVGTGFVLHELAHKYVAIHYGAKAEFRAWRIGLILALVIPIVTFGSFVFAAPGAVYIFGKNISRKENGIISAAGPATNILIALIFFVLMFAGLSDTLVNLCLNVVVINLFLAMFNLIPVFPLDGSKVLAWNAVVWAVMFVPLALFNALFVFRLF
mgnify:CR=1 FL=1